MTGNDKNLIGQKIRIARKNAGLTQEKLAEKIFISTHQLSRLEVGDYIPSLNTFFNIANVLNLTLDDFCINETKQENKMYHKYLKLLNSLNENELEFCYNSTKNLVKNFELLKNN